MLRMVYSFLSFPTLFFLLSFLFHSPHTNQHPHLPAHPCHLQNTHTHTFPLILFPHPNNQHTLPPVPTHIHYSLFPFPQFLTPPLRTPHKHTLRTHLHTMVCDHSHFTATSCIVYDTPPLVLQSQQIATTPEPAPHPPLHRHHPPLPHQQHPLPAPHNPTSQTFLQHSFTPAPRTGIYHGDRLSPPRNNHTQTVLEEHHPNTHA